MNDTKFHQEQAEKGIETKYNSHLLMKEGKKKKGGSGIDSSKAGLWGIAATKSNDIFGSIENGSKGNRKKREEAMALKRENEKNTRMLTAFTLSADARNLLDPTRLLFDSAVIYDDLDIRDKAIKMYEKSTIFCDASAVVDAYDLTEDKSFERRTCLSASLPLCLSASLPLCLSACLLAQRTQRGADGSTTPGGSG